MTGYAFYCKNENRNEVTNSNKVLHNEMDNLISKLSNIQSNFKANMNNNNK